jgi:Zn-dependent protease with chaperone function
VLSIQKPSSFEPAVWVNTQRETDVARFLTALSTDMGVSPPGAVILHVSTSFFATRYPLSVLNANPRGTTLCISLPLLSVLTVNELRAIVAHEFSHFSGGESRYHRLVRPIYCGIIETNRSLSNLDPGNRHSAFVRFFLLVPIFILRMFGTLFLRLDRSLSREFESRADAASAAVCGWKSASSAMQKVVGYGFAFHETFKANMEEVDRSKEPDVNAYRLFRKRLKEYQPLAQKGLAMQMVDYSDAWEQHPSLIKRFEAIPRYPERYNDHGPALALFKQYTGYETMAHQFMFNEYRIHASSNR